MTLDDPFIGDIVRRAGYAPQIDIDTTGVVARARRRRELRRSVGTGSALTVMVFGLIMATGGSPNPGQGALSAASAWEPPKWLVEETTLRAAVREELQTCMDSKGWNVTMDEWGGAAEPFRSTDELERFSSDRDACVAHTAEVLPRTSVEPSVSAYERDLVTRRCFEAQGYEMPAPPTEAQYEAGAEADPYLDPAVGGLPQSTYEQLRVACPEPWSFPAPAH